MQTIVLIFGEKIKINFSYKKHPPGGLHESGYLQPLTIETNGHKTAYINAPIEQDIVIKQLEF